MSAFVFSCHTNTLASDHWLGQPNWRKNSGQFSQKKVWLIVENYGEFVWVGEVSVTLSNA